MKRDGFTCLRGSLGSKRFVCRKIIFKVQAITIREHPQMRIPDRSYFESLLRVSSRATVDG